MPIVLDTVAGAIAHGARPGAPLAGRTIRTTIRLSSNRKSLLGEWR